MYTYFIIPMAGMYSNYACNGITLCDMQQLRAGQIREAAFF